MKPSSAKPVKSEIDKNREKSRFKGDLSFPGDLADHYIEFYIMNYSYERAINRTQLKVGEDSIAKITLPIPTNLVDSYNVDISSKELGLLGKGAADFYTGSGRSPTELRRQVRDNITKLRDFMDQDKFNDVTSDLKEASGQILRRTVNMILPGAGEGLSVASGTAMNPHLALSFDGMQLKNHEFSWTLSPKNENETQMLKKIGDQFKTALKPSFSGPSAFKSVILDYPKLVDIKFGGSVMDIPYFYEFKTCMINNFSLNFAPTGQPTFVSNGIKDYPAFVEMSISLTETQIDVNQNE